MGEVLQFHLKAKELKQDAASQENTRSIAPIVDLRLVTRRDLTVTLHQNQTGTKNTAAAFVSLLMNGKHTVSANRLNGSLNATRL